ncbi:MAG: UDP-glucose/GDP-mannose dehydrogenase family protein [Pseudomonadota bacterium]
MNITFYGGGYVGLVSAAGLAKLGHSVLCIDIDEKKIAALNQAQVDIYEPGLAELVNAMIQAQRLIFSTDIQAGVAHGVAQFITVQSPAMVNGECDQSFIFNVAKSIAQNLTEYRLIINKSTAPVGTVDEIESIIKLELKQRDLNIDFDVASNPEFLREGQALADFLQPDRIILGSQSSQAKKLMSEIYTDFPIEKRVFMDARSAELTKYAANAMLAARISFMNEIANLADKVNANIEAVKNALGMDPRIGSEFLSPGCGYGGSCFPKDVKALIAMMQQQHLSGQLLHAVDEINQQQKLILLKKLQHYYSDLSSKKIALWGLAFKPNTNDIREAPSLDLLQALWSQGAVVKAFDPVAMPEIAKQFGQRSDLILTEDQYACLDDCEALLIVTEWDCFKHADFKLVKKQLKNSLILDGRNCLDKIAVKAHGLDYIGIGV